MAIADIRPADPVAITTAAGHRALRVDDLAILSICIAQLGMGLSPYVETLRHAQYIVGPLALLLWLTVGQRRWHRHSSRFLLAALLIVGTIALSVPTAQSHDYRIVPFLVLPLLTGAFIGTVTQRHITWLWVSVLLAAVLFSLPALSAGNFRFDIVYSSSIAESQMAFPLAILLITMVASHKWLRALLSLLLFTVMLKRIAAGGLLVAAALALFTIPRRQARPAPTGSPLWPLSAMAVFAVAGAFAFNLNAVAYAAYLNFRDVFDTVERLTMGRYAFTQAMQGYMDSSGTLATGLVGFGPGSTRSIIGEPYFHMADFNALNDYLLVRFEYGWLGLSAVFAAYAIAIAQSRWGFVICAFQAVVFITDNTLIYAFHTQVVVVCALFLLSRDRRSQR